MMNMLYMFMRCVFGEYVAGDVWSKGLKTKE